MRDGLQRQLLHEVGDDAEFDAAQNYSGALTRFVLAPESNRNYLVHELTITVQDDDSDYNLYGNLAALTNGVRIVVEQEDGNVELQDLLGGVIVKKTEDWQTAGAEVTPLNSSAGETRSTQIRLEFTPPVFVAGADGQQLAVLLHDNFSTLEGHSFLAEFDRSAN